MEVFTLAEAAAAVQRLSAQGTITELINKHGCLILRGSPDSSPKAFSRLVHAAEEARGHYPYDQIGPADSRTVFGREVFSASEAPQICGSISTMMPKGGESPFCYSTEFYDRVAAGIAEFVTEVQEKGLSSPDIYRALGKEAKKSIFTWVGPLAFGRDIDPSKDDVATMKAKAEIQVKRLTPRFWWREDNQLEVHQYVPAIRRAPGIGRPVFFNSLALESLCPPDSEVEFRLDPSPSLETITLLENFVTFRAFMSHDILFSPKRLGAGIARISVIQFVSLPGKGTRISMGSIDSSALNTVTVSIKPACLDLSSRLIA
ncbi:hypothetical protein LTR10_020882 [Elasticomyces elasticus]|uniref:Uncharacterized protein n=1 Tax=Exophiala sideris TaxID=1016849 RepID=A0ABR0IZL8_9EURO|nr:hypothetical protein LTR10_020882 [Elasticomyces elasticus]KAK5023405.1 hypothetical protein LTS07_009280 [Exophiala sideris]KAK5028219.1 hypothetical protein LTR13_009207 [Exophiala sideris]KAK5052877.1 hypothetical protein LTR69_009703 [Exophiala sideris]KAK5178488.1 hypothetical protein LTR44_009113 [Eurotiomycetes sp. CCFEE 6388]